MLYLFRWVCGIVFIFIGGFGYSYRRYFISIWGLFAFINWLYFGYAKKDILDAWILAPLIIIGFPSVLVRFVFIPNGFVKAAYYFGMASTYYYRQDIKGGAILSAVLAFKRLNSDSQKLEKWLVSKIDSQKNLKWTAYLALILLIQRKGNNKYDTLVVSRDYLEHALVVHDAKKLTALLEKTLSCKELGKVDSDDVRVSYRKVMSHIHNASLKELEFFLELSAYFITFEGLDNQLQVSFVLRKKDKIAELANTLWINGHTFLAKVVMTWLVSQLPLSTRDNEVETLVERYEWYYWVRVLSNKTNWLEVIKSAHHFIKA